MPDHLLGWALAVLAFLEMSLSLLRPDDKDSSAPRLSGPHMVERIGLFVMIVLGESVVQIVNSLDAERSPLTWVTAACAMALMGALWWLIYEASVEKAAMAVEKADANPLDFVGGSQLGIVAGLVLLAAGVADAIWVQGYGQRRITAYVETMRATNDGPGVSTGYGASDDGARAWTP